MIVFKQKDFFYFNQVCGWGFNMYTCPGVCPLAGWEAYIIGLWRWRKAFPGGFHNHILQVYTDSLSQLHKLWFE